MESDRNNTADANTIYTNALNDIGNKKDSSVIAPQIFYNQAWELYVNANYAGAETEALKTLNHKKANAWLKAKASALLGAIKFNKGDKEGAIAAFQTASTIDGNGPIGNLARENLQLITATGDLAINENLQIYPQPANDYLIIEYTGKSFSKITIDLSNLSGEIVYTGQYSSSGYHVLDVKELPAGIYNLKLTSNDFRQVRKIIIQ